ncbi:RNA polymerase, sigma subunit, SigZ [Salinimicrobium catena]|uniref:RNA polymerase, sigma subunit, SigZ n=1 Tax=Salinimicrobium catena TaxID=390640 RepID=A0A1H5PDK9_9FLAO|nr:sigma-70 family RNA polymerase sigma factor [Salinimicrobium catena]SDL77658.1 RNA polymerase sigma-70 factor, ECF subfamily [Salinimicrobium catena]SEF11148.1 RNA polymerase, sigma subunit, SigZ [Salinimicrobium catena]
MTELKKYEQISGFWASYKDALYNYILKLVKDPDTANELSHEVLMKVYGACCSGRPVRNVRSWLFQIAYNTCMDHFNKSGRTAKLKEDVAADEEDLVYREAAEFVKPLLQLLPKKYAEPLELSDIDGLKQQEVAERLGLSHTAAKTRIQRARKLLKDQITECVHLEVDKDGQLTAFQVKGSCAALQAHCTKC